MKLFDLKKILVVSNREDLSTDSIRAEVQKELDIMKRLDHPHIIKLFETMELTLQGTPIICAIMELAEGGELFDRVNNEPLIAEAVCRRWFRQLISALEYSHAHFIIHRDLKLENVLLDSKDNIKLADFGFSTTLTAGQLLRTACGSMVYTAPEIFDGKGYVGIASDMWSVGVIFYALLHGNLPFECNNNNWKQMIHLCKTGQYYVSEELSEEAVDILCALLEPNPFFRIRMRDLRYHPWVMTDYDQPPPCYLPYYPPLRIPHNEDVIAKLCYFGVDPVTVHSSLNEGGCGQEISMYYELIGRQCNGDCCVQPPSPRQTEPLAVRRTVSIGSKISKFFRTAVFKKMRLSSRSQPSSRRTSFSDHSIKKGRSCSVLTVNDITMSKLKLPTRSTNTRTYSCSYPTLSRSSPPSP